MFVPARQLDELVWQDLCEVLTHPRSITEALERAHGGHWLPQELQARRANLQKATASLKQQLERLTEAYLHGVIPLVEYERRRRELEQKDSALEAQEEQLEQQADRHKETSGLAASMEEFCGRVQSALQEATFEQKRQLVELLIDRVVVTDGEVEIRYVIPTTPESEQVRFCHLRTDYFRAPNLVALPDRHSTQQIWVDTMPQRRFAERGAWVDGPQPHRSEKPPYPLGIHRIALLMKPRSHASYPVEGRLRVLLVQKPHQCQVLLGFLSLLQSRLVVEIGAMQPQQLALPPY